MFIKIDTKDISDGRVVLVSIRRKVQYFKKNVVGGVVNGKDNIEDFHVLNAGNNGI